MVQPFSHIPSSPGTSAATPMQPGQQSPPRIDHYLTPPAPGCEPVEPTPYGPYDNVPQTPGVADDVVPQTPGVAELEVLPGSPPVLPPSTQSLEPVGSPFPYSPTAPIDLAQHTQRQRRLLHLLDPRPKTISEPTNDSHYIIRDTTTHGK